MVDAAAAARRLVTGVAIAAWAAGAAVPGKGTGAPRP